MNYEQKYKEALERARDSFTYPDYPGFIRADVVFPELKESQDERIRKEIIAIFEGKIPFTSEEDSKRYIAWLKKQESIDKDKLTKGVLIGVANSIIQLLDANVAEGNMCLSNMECLDIENCVINADWNKVYRYMKKKLEKQDEKKSDNNKEKLDVLNFIRKEACCGLAEADNALLKLIKVLKEHPFPIMDKSYKLKIEWEEQQDEQKDSVVDFKANDWYVSKVDGKIHNIYNSGVEPKESEDERIRKELIENFKWFCGDFPETTKWGKDDDMLVKDIITWIEKQGEERR